MENGILEYSPSQNEWRFKHNVQVETIGWVIINENCEKELAQDFSEFMMNDLGFIPSSIDNIIFNFKVFREGRLNQKQRDKEAAFFYDQQGK